MWPVTKYSTPTSLFLGRVTKSGRYWNRITSYYINYFKLTHLTSALQTFRCYRIIVIIIVITNLHVIMHIVLIMSLRFNFWQRNLVLFHVDSTSSFGGLDGKRSQQITVIYFSFISTLLDVYFCLLCGKNISIVIFYLNIKQTYLI